MGTPEFVLAVVQGVVGLTGHQERARDGELAEARRLAAAAELALAARVISLQVPIALAIESLRTAPSFEGDLALRHAIRARSGR